MATKLNYALTTDQFPLQASPTSGTSNKVKLTVVASNPKPNPKPEDVVTLTGISITILVGPNAAQLASVAPVTVVPPKGWNKSDTKFPEGAVEYVFEPEAGQGKVAEEGLAFTINGVEINTEPGTTTVKIKEGSTGNPMTLLPVTKFPAGWGKVSFSASPQIIKAGEPTTLSWSGPSNATYAIEYTAQSGIVNVPPPNISNQGQYKPDVELDRTTVFYLTVTAVIDNQKYVATRSVTVTVLSLKIKAWGPDEPVNALTPVLLKWQTVLAKTVTIEPIKETVDATLGQFTVNPKQDTTYKLIAKDTKGREKQAIVPVYVKPPQITSFTIMPAKVKFATVRLGSPVTLNWETVSSAKTTLEPGEGDVKESGSVDVEPPAGMTTYTLTAQSQGPFVTAKVKLLATKPGFTLVTSDPGYVLVNAALVVGQKLFMLDTLNAKAWSSTDGTVWSPVKITQPLPLKRFLNAAVVFDAGDGPRMYLIGGADLDTGRAETNEVWRSTDATGTRWEKVQPANNKIWSPRLLFGCVVFKRKIWVLGGFEASSFTYLNEVWSSPDGTNWTLETPNPGWSPRCNFGVSTFILPSPSTNQIWICGGSAKGVGDTNETYYTDDGVKWSKWTGSAAWKPREAPMVQQLGDSLWLMGGIDLTPVPRTPLRDIWSLDGPQHLQWTDYGQQAPWANNVTPATSAVFNGLIWVIGSNRVASDGLNPDVRYFFPG